MIELRKIYQETNRPLGRITLRRLIVGTVLFCIVVICFVALARNVTDGATMPFDTHVLLAINRDLSSPGLNAVMLVFTTIGGPVAITLMTVGLCIYLFLRRQWRALAQVIACVGGAGAINTILKLLFERQRPELWNRLVEPASYSFPSGHAVLSATFALVMIVLLWRTRWRILAIVIGGLFTLLVGFSRLYLGVHYPTDILAGWFVALALVVTVTILIGGLNTPVRAKEFLDRTFQAKR